MGNQRLIQTQTAAADRQQHLDKRTKQPESSIQEVLGSRAASRQFRAQLQRPQAEGASSPKLLHSILQSISPISPRAIQAKPKFRGLSHELTSAIDSDGMVIQAKMTIQPPGDQYEQQADRVAEQVVQKMHAPSAQESMLGEPSQRQKREEDGHGLRMKPLPQRQPGGGMAATQDLESSINRARGGGQPLEIGLQKKLGQAIGADFSGVKVHTDAQADQLNRSIQAKAFTTGQDVFFQQGAYQPGSRGGQELIAHELTHVVQQKGLGEVRGKLIQRVSDTGLANLSLSKSFVSTSIEVFKNWNALTEKERSKALMDAVNQELSKIDVPIVMGLIDPLNNLSAEENAVFVRGNWQIWFNQEAFADHQDPVQLNRLANHVYHESRHAEQTYRVARLMAQKGKDANTIKTSLGIPITIAAQAVANPLALPGEKPKVIGKKAWKGRVKEWKEAESWEMNISTEGGGTSALSDMVNAKKDEVMDEYRKIQSAYWFAKNNPTDANIATLSKEQLAHLEMMYIKAREYAKQAYLQYAKMPVEEDAWSVGGQIEEILGQAASTPEKQLENLEADVRRMLKMGSAELVMAAMKGEFK